MPLNKYVYLARVKAVEVEYQAMRFAASFTLEAVRRDVGLFRGGLKTSDLELASSELEATYIIRLFAEFETCLRTYWRDVRGTDPPSRTRDLLDGVAARCKVATEVSGKAHAVREFRNSLIHERLSETEEVTIREARSCLCHFLSSLPKNW
jgi:hypothetical protein